MQEHITSKMLPATASTFEFTARTTGFWSPICQAAMYKNDFRICTPLPNPMIHYFLVDT